MYLYSEKNQKALIEMSGRIFLWFASSEKYFGVILDASELDSSELEKIFPKGKFDCKAVGSKKYSAIISELISRRNGNLIRYVEKENGKIYFDCSSGRLRVEKSETEPAEPQRKIRVMIVDDSNTIRSLLKKVIAMDALFEVIGDFSDPQEALDKVAELRPDVITLDIHMPRMDGIQFLQKLLPSIYIPVVMISSISREESNVVLSALEAGAVDYIQKPSLEEVPIVGQQILEKLRIASQVRRLPGNSSPVALEAYSLAENLQLDLSRVIAIGSSTGGTEALREVLTKLPASIPPILIVQHIPAVFSRAFADRMNALCSFRVAEAVDGELVAPGNCYIAPGGKQMCLRKDSSGRLSIRIFEGELVNRHRPSVDVLFSSVAELCGSKAVGAILTGMGADGAKGLLEMKQAGSATFGQSEASCVVYGMPQAAKKLGAVEREAPLQQIPKLLLEAVAVRRKSLGRSA